MNYCVRTTNQKPLKGDTVSVYCCKQSRYPSVVHVFCLIFHLFSSVSHREI